MAQERFLQQLRSRLYTGADAKTTAIAAVKSQMSTANDGSFVLGRYQDDKNNIRTVIGVNYVDGNTVNMSIYDFDKIASDSLLTRVSTIETTLGISEDGTVTGKTIVGRIENVEDLLEILNGTETAEGSIKKQIKDAVDAEESERIASDKELETAINGEVSRAEDAESTLQKAIDNEVSARTTADTQIRADFVYADEALQKAIDNEVSARKDADTELENKLMGEVDETDAKTIAALNDKIDEVSYAAKSYSIVSVTEGLDTNVKEAWKLVDEDGAQAGAQINIYKDSSLEKVELVGQELRFTYILSNGNTSIVSVDVSNFLAESEFLDGLKVDNHVVYVKIDDTSENFLTVSTNGVKLSGVQDAIDTVNTSLTNTINNFKTDYNTKIAALEAKDTNLESAISGETVERKSADEKLQNQLDTITGNGENSISSKITEAIDDLKGTPEGKTINESYDTIYEIAEELAKLEGDETKEGSIAYDIKSKVDSLDSTKTGDGTFVDVTVTQVDGVITEVSVAESDIASAKDLSNEIERATKAEEANSDAIATEKSRAEEVEAAIRTDFAAADTTLKNELLGDAADGYNTLGKLEDAIQAVDAKIVSLDVTDSEIVGSYVTSVSQEDGKISNVKKSLVSSANENNMLAADTTNGGLTLSNVWDCGTFEYEPTEE